MKPYTFEEMWEELKNSGTEEERKTMVEAEMLANIIHEVSEARIKAGLTQAQLAEKCGMKQSAIARFENLSVMPKLDTVVKIAASLSLNMEIKPEEEPETEGTQIVYLYRGTEDGKYSWENPQSVNEGKIHEYVG
ncbi:MAG: helix-turn-helix transcriptional regulator [Oscillospiraceae bacterium]|nr:helix-turn-helix transcriptional regulator [Oscillospiraceae bacterium]